MDQEFREHLEAARQGDEGSWRWIILKWHTHLLKKADRYLRNHDEAQDAVSDFFLMAVRKNLLHKFRGSSILEFNAYISTCMLNMLHNHKKPLETVAQEVIEEIVVFETPVVVYETKANSQILQDAMSELPLTYRTVIELQFFRKHSQKEISLLLDIPLNTVSSHSRRARELLGKILKNRGLFALSL